MTNKDIYESKDQRDIDWFIPRYRKVLESAGHKLYRFESTRNKYGDKYHTWDVEVDVTARNGYTYHTVVELKDRGTGGYRLNDFLNGGRCSEGIIMDRGKCIEWYTKKGSPRGLYVWLFPADNVMIVAKWYEACCEARTMPTTVNANTLRSREDKVSKYNYVLPLADYDWLYVYRFDENNEPARVSIDALNREREAEMEEQLRHDIK